MKSEYRHYVLALEFGSSQKRVFGLDDLSFALPSPFSKYCLSLGRGWHPDEFLDSDDFSLPSNLYDGFIAISLPCGINIKRCNCKSRSKKKRLKGLLKKEAQRIAEEKEAQRIAEEKEAQRINQQLRAQRINQQQEALRINQQREAQRLAEEREAQLINQQLRAKQINQQRSAQQNTEEVQRNLISDELIGAIGVLMLLFLSMLSRIKATYSRRFLEHTTDVIHWHLGK